MRKHLDIPQLGADLLPVVYAEVVSTGYQSHVVELFVTELSDSLIENNVINSACVCPVY